MCAGCPSSMSGLRQAVHHRVLVTPYPLNLTAVEQLKPLISAVEVYPRVSVHQPRLPESYQPKPSAPLHPGQSTQSDTRAKSDTRAELIRAFGNWDDLCTDTYFLNAFKNFIIQFLVLAGQGWDTAITTRRSILWPSYFLWSWGKLRGPSRGIKS